MKTFTLQELVSFIEANPDNRADYGNPTLKAGRELQDTCLMCQFYKSKGIDIFEASYMGGEAHDTNNEVIARCELPEYIGYIHNGANTFSQILERMKKRGWIQ